MMDSQPGLQRMLRDVLALIAILFILANAMPAYASDTFHEDISFARDVYLEATDGNKRNVRKAIQHMTNLEGKYPNHPLVQAFKGGALSLRGLDVADRPSNRLRNTEEGLTYIDRALRNLDRAQENVVDAAETQLVATYVFVNLPDSMFHRLRDGVRLVEELLVNPHFSEMPEKMRAAIYFAAATAAEKRQKQADFKHYLALTVDIDPDGRSGKAAREKLDALASLP